MGPLFPHLSKNTDVIQKVKYIFPLYLYCTLITRSWMQKFLGITFPAKFFPPVGDKTSFIVIQWAISTHKSTNEILALLAARTEFPFI